MHWLSLLLQIKSWFSFENLFKGFGNGLWNLLPGFVVQWPFESYTTEDWLWRLLWVLIGIVLTFSTSIPIKLYVEPWINRRIERNNQRRKANQRGASVPQTTLDSSIQEGDHE